MMAAGLLDIVQLAVMFYSSADNATQVQLLLL
jgi:hypothetical protein